jgi:hypothetical protein
MNWTPNRRNLLKTGAAAAALGFTGRTAWAQDIPTTPETGDIKMGIEPPASCNAATSPRIPP